MESFYLIVLGIAIVMLILVLTGIGLLMRTQTASSVYPPMANTCPDGWTIAADGSCTIPSTGPNRGFIIAGTSYTQTDIQNSLLKSTKKDGPYPGTSFTASSFSPTDADWSSNKLSAVCQQKKWANTNNIVWDGISNYNSC